MGAEDDEFGDGLPDLGAGALQQVLREAAWLGEEHVVAEPGASCRGGAG